MTINEIETRSTIVKLFHDNPTYTYGKIAKLAKVTRKTGSKVIRNFKSNLSVQRKEGSGLIKGFRTKKLDKKVVDVIEKLPSISTRDIAKKCKTLPAMIQRIKARNNLKTFKKRKIPKKSIKQFNEGIDRAKKLHQWLQDKKEFCIIEDDETYVKMDFVTLPGPQYYTKKQGTELDESKTTIPIEKFGEKRMVWQAICQCGLGAQLSSLMKLWIESQIAQSHEKKTNLN